MTTSALLQSFVGGFTIPIAAHVLLLLNGNIFGISGFVHRAVRGHVQDVVSLSGLILGGVAAARLEAMGPVPLSLSPWKILLSGFLVGLGSKLANGCTSGHMICGISRLSVRSIAATATFFVTGVITARILHGDLQPSATAVDWTLGNRGIKLLALQAIPLSLNLLIYALASLIDKPIAEAKPEPNSVNQPQSNLRILARLFTSFQFALALHLSNLNDARRVLSFLLPFHRAFDPSLALVAAGALPTGILLYHFVRGSGHARLGGTTLVKPGKIDGRLLIGSAVFGIGWGMAGICPGPGLVNFGLSLGIGAHAREMAPFFGWLGSMALGGLLV
ncbi:DUF395-domain-containing protein [Phlegmacium glaucopus]|nr:DUF395-domain-containing protein [Phlegmacium glaucopus]